MEQAVPRLSVVITSYNARETIAACLASLHRQTSEHAFEIVLVDSSTDGTAALVEERFPEVRLIRSTRRLHCGDARNRALTAARAGVIAFLDADCTVESHWVDRVLRAHRPDVLLAGGVIDNAERRSLVGWAYYFCEYSLWLPARSARRMREMAGCCLSLKRAAYERYGPFIEGTYSSDTAFQWKASREGVRVLFTPEIRVFHRGPTNFRRFLAHTYIHRQAYARVRAREKELGALRRAADVAILPITPLLLMGATLVRLRRWPGYFFYWLLCAPLLFSGYCARSAGEFSGYLREWQAGHHR